MARVLHVVQTLKGGGAETLVRDMLPRMRARGVDVAVASVYPSNLTPQEKLKLRCDVFELNRKDRLDLRAPLQLWRLMRQLNPDIVHTHVTTGKYWGRACAIASGIRTIVHTEHSPDPNLEFWERPASLFLNLRTSAIVTFSERTAAFIKQREAPPRLYVIPNGIEICERPDQYQREAARASLNAGERVIIGVVASLYPLKNHALALRAFSLLPSFVRERSRLDIFGSGPLEGELKSLARDLGVTDYVVFHGFRPDVRSLLPGLDLFLSVALAEAAPISFLEAMCACVPIVATPSIGALDMVEDQATGLISKSWSDQEVARLLERALTDAEWRARSIDNAWERLVRNYDIESTVEMYVKLYRELTPKSRLAAAAF